MTYSRGKHLKEKKSKKSNKKQILLFKIFLLVVCTIFVFKMHSEMKENQKLQSKEAVSGMTTTKIDGISGALQVDMPEEIGGYNVIGELVIEKINFKNYILNKTTDDSLQIPRRICLRI